MQRRNPSRVQVQQLVNTSIITHDSETTCKWSSERESIYKHNSFN